MIIGMDFGTTNSGIATYDGRRLQLIPFGRSSADGNITRTALYITNDQTVTIGRAAIDQYQAHNLGRPSRIERFKIGMTSITYPDIGTVWEDIYSERDVLAPGRLFLSFKSSLSSTAYRGTTVGSLDYELEDIVAIYLYLAKIRAEQVLGQEVREIVLGRPVHFAADSEADALAERRLIEAAWRAGYETVYMQYEPVAVALEYATSITSEQHVLVFDFGGGTLDVAAVQLDNRGQRRVLATGGIPVAGDVFDQRVVRNKLAPRLGEGTHFGPRNKRRDVPTWIYDDLSNWQTISLLQATRHAPLLNDLRATTDQPTKIEPLLQIISQNHGLTMFDAVERAKRGLSDKTEATIAITGEQLDVREPITRPEFERLIQREVRSVDALIDSVVRDADLAHSDIDMVVRTGGSSQIPVFVDLLRRKFGPERVRAVDTFSSVTAGLGVMAHRIATGEAELPAHRRPAAAPDPTDEGGTVNIRFLKRWIDAQEGAAAATDAQRVAFVQLASEGRVLATLVPDALWTERQSIPLSMQDAAALSSNQVALATLDERVLMVTSSYRFLLTTPRRLLVLQEMGLRLVELERFAPGERVCVLTPWSAIKSARWLTIIANQGDMRLLDLAKLKGSLERVLPVQLDQKPAGTPIATVGADEGQEIALVTDAARALRVPVTATAAVGIQAIKRDKDEAIITALPLRAGDHLLLVSPEGITRTVGANDISLRSNTSARGKVIALRFAVGAAAVQAPDDLWLVTSTHLRPLAINSPSGATRKQGQARIDLEANEKIIALLHAHPAQSPAQAMSDE